MDRTAIRRKNREEERREDPYGRERERERTTRGTRDTVHEEEEGKRREGRERDTRWKKHRGETRK